MRLMTTNTEEKITANQFQAELREINDKIERLNIKLKEFKICGNCAHMNMKGTSRFKRCSVLGLRDPESLACKDWILHKDDEWRMGL